MIRYLPLLVVAWLALDARADTTTVYKCTDAAGSVTYQGQPCPASKRQQSLHLVDRPSKPAPPMSIPPPSPTASDETPLVQTTPAAPLPVMYRCLRATDGSSYLSDRGDPPPYQAPFGMLGAVQSPLADAYGHGGGASAPELNRGKVTSGLVAGNYVWVQDQCRELGPQETCQALQDAYDENEHKLKQAFKSERPPFERREAELQAQLTHC